LNSSQSGDRPDLYRDPQPLGDNPLQTHFAGKVMILVERVLSRASLPAEPN
jgi:hypothetical protein